MDQREGEPRAVSCGCCVGGCVCAIHQDIPNGAPAQSCGYHAEHGHPGVTHPHRCEACGGRIPAGHAVMRLELGERPSHETLHKRCYDYTRSVVARVLAAERARSRPA